MDYQRLLCKARVNISMKEVWMTPEVNKVCKSAQLSVLIAFKSFWRRGKGRSACLYALLNFKDLNEITSGWRHKTPTAAYVGFSRRYVVGYSSCGDCFVIEVSKLGHPWRRHQSSMGCYLSVCGCIRFRNQSSASITKASTSDYPWWWHKHRVSKWRLWM